MKYIKTYENIVIDDLLAYKYIVVKLTSYGLFEVIGVHQGPFGDLEVEVKKLYVTDENGDVKSFKESQPIEVRLRHLKTLIVYETDDLEEAIEHLKLAPDMNKYNI